MRANKYCCEFMKQQLNYTCAEHGDGDKCPHVVIGRARSGRLHKGKIQLLARNGEYPLRSQSAFLTNRLLKELGV